MSEATKLVSLIKKKPKVEKRIQYAQHRVINLSNSSLFEWTEQCLYTYGKAMKEAQETADNDYALTLLAEAELAAGVMREIAAELTNRMQIDTIR